MFHVNLFVFNHFAFFFLIGLKTFQVDWYDIRFLWMIEQLIPIWRSQETFLVKFIFDYFFPPGSSHCSDKRRAGKSRELLFEVQGICLPISAMRKHTSWVLNRKHLLKEKKVILQDTSCKAAVWLLSEIANSSFPETSKEEYVLFEAAGLIEQAFLREYTSTPVQDINAVREFLIQHITTNLSLTSVLRKKLSKVKYLYENLSRLVNCIGLVTVHWNGCSREKLKCRHYSFTRIGKILRVQHTNRSLASINLIEAGIKYSKSCYSYTWKSPQ